jgi:hypothetical protein
MSRDRYSSIFWLIMQEAQVYTAHATPSGSDMKTRFYDVRLRDAHKRFDPKSLW